MSGSGIPWAVCKSAPRSCQITTPVPHHSVLQAGCPSCRPTNSVKALKVSRTPVEDVCICLLLCLVTGTASSACSSSSGGRCFTGSVTAPASVPVQPCGQCEWSRGRRPAGIGRRRRSSAHSYDTQLISLPHHQGGERFVTSSSSSSSGALFLQPVKHRWPCPEHIMANPNPNANPNHIHTYTRPSRFDGLQK